MQIKVDALSSSANNARQIRDAIMAMPASKGAPDIREAMVAYPEICGRVAAVISAAGSVGGLALANHAEQYQADLLRHFPGATCDSGDGGAINSLRPVTRKRWLAQNRPPSELKCYSLVTFPHPDHISAVLKSSIAAHGRRQQSVEAQLG
ncbi:hypothetical protein V0M98_09950 [Pseudomonas silesiensis]|uniref:hypothetical protein n=1 Tax=Pseudomonas silesiensis TaxID=1853130 RepID=UPI0030D1E0BC